MRLLDRIKSQNMGALLFGASALVVSNDAPALVKAASNIGNRLLGNRIQVCDGTADDVQIQAAVDALPAGRTQKLKVLCIGGGFEISDTIVLPAYTILELEGRIKLADNADVHMVENATGGDTDIEIIGGEYDGNRANQTPNTLFGIFLLGVTRFLIHGVTVKSCNKYDVQISACFQGSVENCIFYDSWEDGCEVTGSKHITISGCVAYGNKVSVSANGFEIEGSESCQIVGCTAYDNYTGFSIEDVSYHCAIVGCTSRGHTYRGFSVKNQAHYVTISGCTSYADGAPNHSIHIHDSSHVTIQGCTVWKDDDIGNVGIYLYQAPDCVVTGNILYGGDVSIANTVGIWLLPLVGTVMGNCIITNNRVEKWNTGIKTNNSDAHNTLVKNNNCIDCNVPIVDLGTNSHIYDRYSDLFMDVLAVSANHVVAAQALELADPTVCVIAAQPDVPRTLSWAFTHPTLTAYTMEIIGVDAKGGAITLTWDQTAGWSGETSVAFATITSITVKDMANEALGDILNVGITDVLGLSNVVYAAADVYKIKENNADLAVVGGQVDTDYDTYDLNGAIGGGDDFTIWFRSNLNVID